MADVTVDAATPDSLARDYRTLVWKSDTVGYLFTIDSVLTDLVVWKTTDSGQNWGETVLVEGTFCNVDVWYDKWTPGDTGVIIHLAYVDSANHTILYAAFETTGDTLGTPVTVFDSDSSDAGQALVSIAKARGGNIVITYDLDVLGTRQGAEKSTDAGATFGAIATPWEAVADYACIFPGNDADNQDMYLIFVDRSANAISLKVYDDSLDSWGETAIATMTDTTPANGIGFTGSVRHSDGHLLIAFFNAYDSATGDFETWDINGAASITQTGTVFSDIDDVYHPAMFINQTTDDVYLAYDGKSDGSETISSATTVVYRISDDAMATWGSELTYAEAQHANRVVWSDLGGTTSRFEPAFRDITADDIFVNYTNSVAIGAAATTKAPPPLITFRPYRNLVRFTR